MGRRLPEWTATSRLGLSIYFPVFLNFSAFFSSACKKPNGKGLQYRLLSILQSFVPLLPNSHSTVLLASGLSSKVIFDQFMSVKECKFFFLTFFWLLHPNPRACLSPPKLWWAFRHLLMCSHRFWSWALFLLYDWLHLLFILSLKQENQFHR